MAKDMTKYVGPFGLKSYILLIFKIWIVIMLVQSGYESIKAGGKFIEFHFYVHYPTLIGFAVGWYFWKGHFKEWVGIFDGLKPAIIQEMKKEHMAQTRKDLKTYEMIDVENVWIKSSCKRNGETIPLKDAKNPICDECKEKKPFHCSYAQL